jgi:UDP-GlcNAc:undecaprenyl-phosphate GlcNAc-1-phosphate transferase
MNITTLVSWKAFAIALAACLVLTPLARVVAMRYEILDRPISPIKTHKTPVPYLGGVAIFLSFAIAIIVIRFNTAFPSGTLTALRGLLTGSGLIFLLGFVDDVKHHGLHYRTKFFFQISAACMAVLFGIRIRFIHPTWMADIVTIVWIVGITNAFNLIDIMDGLASGVAGVATMAFLLIALPTEEVYVNVAAAALCGAVLGFFPYNVSKRYRIFMGDCGSLLLGFVCSLLALGTSYSQTNQWAVFAPLLILCLPIFETCLLFAARVRKGISPFLGSKDHFALRMEVLGWRRPQILVFALLFSTLMCLAAYAVTRVSALGQLVVYSGALLLVLGFSAYVAKADIR